MKTNWFDRQLFSIEIKYIDTPGYSGPVPIYLCGYRGEYIEREYIPPKSPEINYKICVICKREFTKTAGYKLTCGSICSDTLRIRRKQQDNEIFRKNCSGFISQSTSENINDNIIRNETEESSTEA